jgi:uncharacterized protein YdcH (DUF465 family)
MILVNCMKILSIKLLVIICLACGSVFAQTNDQLAEQSFAALQAGKIQESITLCEKVLQAEAGNTLAAYTCGIANFQAQRYPLAEKYLAAVETVKKDDAQLYAFLGAAYYANRAQKHILADLNTSLEYLAKSVKLEPKSGYPYLYRAKIYLSYYDIGGLRSDLKLKEAYYADLRQLMLLAPENLSVKYEFAKNSTVFEDYGQAIPVFAKLMESPLINMKVTEDVCRDAAFNVERSERKQDNPKLLTDSISLMKGCQNAYVKLEADETTKKQKVSEFRAKIIQYRMSKAASLKSDYLASPELLAELTEAINAGETQYYDKRIEVYTFLKQFAKADADKKSKVIAVETKEINELIAKETRLRQEENDFSQRITKEKGGLDVNDFQKVHTMKKARLIVLDKILASNLPPKDKEPFNARRIQLADIIQKADATVAEKAEKNKQIVREQNRDSGLISEYNKEIETANEHYKKADEIARSLDNCEYRTDKKKCGIEKLELMLNQLRYVVEKLEDARDVANRMNDYDNKRKFVDSVNSSIKGVEDTIKNTENDLKKLRGY